MRHTNLKLLDLTMDGNDFFNNPKLFGPKCVINALGVEFDPEAFLSQTSFDPEVILWFGKMGMPEQVKIDVAEKVEAEAAKLIDARYLVLLVSDSVVHSTQHEQAIRFLRHHRKEIIRLAEFPNVEQVNLRCMPAEGEPIEQHPEELLNLAYECGLTFLM